MAYLHQNHQIQGGAEQRKHHHRYSNPVLVKPVHGCSDSGAHREGAYPNHKPEAVNSGKEGTDALKNRKKRSWTRRSRLERCHSRRASVATALF
jgi:hypothetical protein